MKKFRILFFVAFFASLLFALNSCKQIILEDIENEGKCKVSFKISSIENFPFESADRACVADLVSRFSLALFQDGTKVASSAQTSEDMDFGMVTLFLTPGHYDVVAIAHNGRGNCTISSPEKVTFANNKCTDTFYYYGSFELGASSRTEVSDVVSLVLKRSVAMFRLKITDAMPESVTQMQFYYTGGSSTFNPSTGFGCVNSKQTETFSITADEYGKPAQFEVYTFPHETEDFLNVRVTALSSDGSSVAEMSMDNLYVKINTITQHTTTFFSETNSSTAVSFSILDDGKWSGVVEQ